MGTKTADTVNEGRRTVVWESDHPVNFFNVIAGRWQVERGEGTAIYYDAAHPYNIAEMREGLDAARRYYSQWFFEYPWRELKLSEFPNLATYAQGFPTNITFSEGIGFLTASSPEIHAAFEITGHEAAHQWWGNILTPGKGPGGNILSEGTAHFSTILLVEQVKGLNARIDFCKRLEAGYGRDRQADSERPLVKITGERPGDTTVTYDKGGWVFWMLMNQMGREKALAGMQAFIKAYHGNTDHPVLQDFLASMRPFAADAAAFDAFTHQWFYEVVVPEYRLSEPKKVRERARLEGDASSSKMSGRASCPSRSRPRAASGSPRMERPHPITARPARRSPSARANRATSSSSAPSSPSGSSSTPTPRCFSFGARVPRSTSDRTRCDRAQSASIPPRATAGHCLRGDDALSSDPEQARGSNHSSTYAFLKKTSRFTSRVLILGAWASRRAAPST